MSILAVRTPPLRAFPWSTPAMTDPSAPLNADRLLRLLLEGLLERITWSCQVFEIPGPGPVRPLRSEFSAYAEIEGHLLRLRSQCDRSPAEEPGEGAVEFRFVVQEIDGLPPRDEVATGSAAIRLFGALRHVHAWVLEMEARRPFRPEANPLEGTFDAFVDRVNRHSPALWQWRLLTHEGPVRVLEHRYETRLDDGLRLTLHEFTDAATGNVRCHARLECLDAGDRPVPLFDSLEASVLVALVKRHALAARKAQG